MHTLITFEWACVVTLFNHHILLQFSRWKHLIDLYADAVHLKYHETGFIPLSFIHPANHPFHSCYACTTTRIPIVPIYGCMHACISGGYIIKMSMNVAESNDNRRLLWVWVCWFVLTFLNRPRQVVHDVDRCNMRASLVSILTFQET